MKPVNDFVSKLWARSAKEILTGYSPELHKIFTQLLTLRVEHQQGMKTTAARLRVEEATEMLIDALKFGWSHGLNAGQCRFTRPPKQKGHRRVGALLPLAIAAGERIGKDQAARISRAHPHAQTRPQALKHTHATTA